MSEWQGPWRCPECREILSSHETPHMWKNTPYGYCNGDPIPYERRRAPQPDALVEARVREYLAFSHTDGKCNIYGDDGELQCANLARHGRTIDFRRESIGDLLDIIIETRQREYAAAPAPSHPLVDVGRPLRDALAAHKRSMEIAPRPERTYSAEGWKCKANRTADPPQDCDWPHCGCDPNAEKVIEALIEEGWGPNPGTGKRTYSAEDAIQLQRAAFIGCLTFLTVKGWIAYPSEVLADVQAEAESRYREHKEKE